MDGYQKLADRILIYLKRHGYLGDAAVVVELLPNARLRELKRKYLKKTAKIVDVLAFPALPTPPKQLRRPSAKATAGKPAHYFPEPDSKVPSLGEVYLNQTIVRRDPDRAAFLLVHGVLHLLGFSHRTKRATIRMEKLEKRILIELRALNY